MNNASIPDNPNALLSQDELAAAFSAVGIPIKPKTLSTKRSRGDSPPFVKFGKYVRYRWGPALAWAEARLGAPRNSTSETDARGAA